METSPDLSDWQKRYSVIEKVYCQGRWATVMEAGTLLLRDLLEAGGEPEVAALRHRMQLLMAHTLLHGYGDRDAAEDLYEVVRQSEAEPALRQIAEDGLDQCHQPLISPLAAEEDEGDVGVPSRPMLFLPETERTDLEEEAGVVQPSRAASPAAFLPQNLLPTIPTQPKPELVEAVAPPPTETVKAQGSSQPAAGATDRGLAADPFTLPAGLSPPGAPQGGAPVMPWLTQPSPAEVGEPVANDLPWLQEKPTPPSPLTPALIPDVVDEPELMEVHQANPLLAEEVVVQVKSSSPPPEIGPEIEPEESEEEDGELRTGLLLVVVG